MNTRRLTIRLLSTLLFILGSAFLCAGWRPIKNASIPVNLTVSPAVAAPNSDVTFTVFLNGNSGGGEYLSIGCTDPDAFTYIPAEVPVPDGASSVTFQARTSSSYSAAVIVTATQNAVSVLRLF